MRVRRAVMLGVFVSLSLGAGTIGGRLVPPALGSWFAQLRRPAWTPPISTFAFIWTAVYILMGVAAFLLWDEVGFQEGEAALLLFFIQLALNAAWGWIFFGLQLPGAAFADNVALWVVVLVTTIAFWRLRRAAGAMMVPYLAWVSFVIVLNATIWRMNR